MEPGGLLTAGCASGFRGFEARQWAGVAFGEVVVGGGSRECFGLTCLSACSFRLAFATAGYMEGLMGVIACTPGFTLQDHPPSGTPAGSLPWLETELLHIYTVLLATAP